MWINTQQVTLTHKITSIVILTEPLIANTYGGKIRKPLIPKMK